MSNKKKIEQLEDQKEAIEKEILRLMEIDYNNEHKIDVKPGQTVAFRDFTTADGIILAKVIDAKFVASIFAGEIEINAVLTCKDKNGLIHTRLLCEVEVG